MCVMSDWGDSRSRIEGVMGDDHKAAGRFKGRLRFARAFETVGRAESVFGVGRAAPQANG